MAQPQRDFCRSLLPRIDRTLHLRDELVRRFKRNFSVRQRSKLIQRLLEERCRQQMTAIARQKPGR
jgi:hypothetical protein